MKYTIPITKSTLSPYSAYHKRFREVIASGMITSGKYVAQLEREAATFLGVKYCVAVSSCTAGMMLVLKGLGLKGEVILPSFTFSATGHALMWNNLTPVFADIDSKTLSVDPQSVEKLITKKTSAIVAVHMFGSPCDVERLERVAKAHKLKLIFDAAHAFGAKHKGAHIGVFGEAEIFSCSPTKLMIAGEGGIIATNNKRLATFCRQGRNYGDDGTYNTQFYGLSARLSELHAILALESLRQLPKNIRRRQQQVTYFKAQLKKIDPRIEFQKITGGDQTTFKDFSIFIPPAVFGFDRDELAKYLLTKGIVTKPYFYPPLHEQEAYRSYKKKYHALLPVTNRVSREVLSLPMYSHIAKNEIDYIIKQIANFYHDRLRS